MKLFKSVRRYGNIQIVEMCWADNEDEVYSLLSWEKNDKPPLEIEEIPIKKGCFLSISTRSLS